MLQKYSTAGEEPQQARAQASANAADLTLRRADVSKLFREHNRLLVRYLEARLQSHQEAKDVAQEAYVRLLTLERTGAVGFLRAYLFKIASNLAIDRIRSRSVRGRADALDLFEEGGDPDWVEKKVSAAEQAQLFWASLGELQPHYRQALVMSRLQDLSSKQIAQHLGKTERMIRRYIAYALIYCRQRIDGRTPAQARASIHDE
jgi:RNA polymerase sigma factor (sigma-70 family)